MCENLYLGNLTPYPLSILRPFDKLRVLSGSTLLTILRTSKDKAEAQAQDGESSTLSSDRRAKSNREMERGSS